MKGDNGGDGSGGSDSARHSDDTPRNRMACRMTSDNNTLIYCAYRFPRGFKSFGALKGRTLTPALDNIYG